MRRMKTMKRAKAVVQGTQHLQGATRRGTRLSSKVLTGTFLLALVAELPLHAMPAGVEYLPVETGLGLHLRAGVVERALC